MNQHIITITALGPDSGEMITLGALNTMLEAKRLVLRTAMHGAAKLLSERGIGFESLDPLYEQCEILMSCACWHRTG